MLRPTTVLLGLTLLTPVALAADGDAIRGEEAYVLHCAECHATASRIAARIEGEDDAAKTAAMEAFLPDHFAEDPQERADIIAYLLTL